VNDPIALSPPSLSPASSNSVPAPAKTRWPLYLTGAVVALGVIALGVASGAYSKWHSGSLIVPGVSVAGVDVSGLTKSQASAQIAEHFGDLPLKLTVGKQSFDVTVAQLGGVPSVDFTVAKAAKIGRDSGAVSNFLRVYGTRTAGERLMLPVEWDKVALLSQLKKLDKNYAAKAINARLVVDAGGVSVVRERLGRRLNVGATAKAIQQRYFVGTHALKAYTRQIAPVVSAADLQGQDVLLASYKTRFNPGLEGRTANIHVACAAIDGHVLMPGETFSFNALTGERTWKKGYRMAHIFETKPGAKEAEVVDGLAGGVCQVSSTLFNAVRRTNDQTGAKNLKIVERNTHSLPVTYVPFGLDATVAWPGKDFRFRNRFNHPIYLRTLVGRSKLTIGVWGRVPDSGEKALQNSL